LSNNHSIPSKKIIQIKSPNYFYNEKSSKNLVSEEVKEMESIQSEITLASKQLEQLKNQREKLLQTTKMEIETEKKNWEKEKLSLVQRLFDGTALIHFLLSLHLLFLQKKSLNLNFQFLHQINAYKLALKHLDLEQLIELLLFVSQLKQTFVSPMFIPP